MQIQFAFLNSKVAKRIFFLFVVAAIVPVILIGILSYNYVTHLLTKQNQESLIASSKAYGMAIYDRILVAENQFNRLGEDILLSSDIDFTSNADTQIMLDLNVSLFSDIEIYVKPSNFNSTDLKHLLDGASKITVSRNSDNTLDIFFTKMLNTVEASRLLSAKVDSKYIFGDLDIFAGDEDACIIAKNKGLLNCSDINLNTISKSTFERYLQNGKDAHTIYINDKSYIIANWELFLHGRFNTDSWIIFYTQPSKVILAPIKAFANTLLPTLLLSILIVSLISVNQISRILVPLEILTNATKNIAKNDFRNKVELKSKDEFQLLGDSFNIMSSELKERQKKLQYRAYYDDLTGLPNRRLFNKLLKKKISDALSKNKIVAILFIDLDNFKTINDTQGHAIGDKLLIAVSNRIKSCIGVSNNLARYGGDEFAVILPSINNVRIASAIANGIISELSKAFYIDNFEQFIGASIGISEFPMHGTTHEILVQKADIAMYEAKQKGRSRHIVYNHSMQDEICEKAELQADLFHAIERSELHLVYQPQIDLRSGNISGAETLLRWNHSKKGAIRPDQFISYAEESGLIVKIGNWVMRESIQQCEKWQLEHQSMPKIAINISAKQLRHEDFFSDVENLVSEYNVGLTNIEFEITESLFINDDKITLDKLHRLNALGINIAIDDFGKGYSSLSYLKNLPAQTLKIDRIFIKDLNHDKNSISIVKAIIIMAKTMNKTVVAEGVETLEQLNILKDLDCDRAQGFYISKPKVAEEFMDYSKTEILNLEEFRANLKIVS